MDAKTNGDPQFFGFFVAMEDMRLSSEIVVSSTTRCTYDQSPAPRPLKGHAPPATRASTLTA